jgi:hypothetical protein
MPFSIATRNNILKHLTLEATWAAPAALYLSFSSDDPGVTFAPTEPTEGNFARKAITNTEWAVVAAVTDGVVPTDTLVQWTTADANWESGNALTHLLCWDHITGVTAAQFLWYGALDVSKPVTNGDTAKIPSAGVTLTVS